MDRNINFYRGVLEGVDLLRSRINLLDYPISKVDIDEIVELLTRNVTEEISSYRRSIYRQERQNIKEITDYGWVFSVFKEIPIDTNNYYEQAVAKEIVSNTPTIDEVLDFIEILRVDRDCIKSMEKKLFIQTVGLNSYKLFTPLNLNSNGTSKLFDVK
jgi:hypothetical protein